MKLMAGVIAGAFAVLAAAGGASAAQRSGVVGSGAPEDIFLRLTPDAKGGFSLSDTQFHLALGGYYRFNLECPPKGPQNEAGISFAAPELWENSHLRLVSVSDPKSGFETAPEINFHVQGLQIREIECEGFTAAARFSFFPMRKGTYPFTVVDETVKPSRETKGSFVVE